MNPTASDGWFNQSMSDHIAVVNGSHEVEEALMKAAYPTKDQSYMPKNGDGVNDHTMGHMESQSDSRTTHRRSSLQDVALSRPLIQTFSLDSKRVTSTMSSSNDRQMTILKETILSTCSKLITEFDDVNESLIQNMSIEGFLEYVERQRLTHMPHRGSRWDRVLKWTEYFALQISGYTKAVESFMRDSNFAAKLIWTSCRALLEVNVLLVACRLLLMTIARSRKCPSP